MCSTICVCIPCIECPKVQREDPSP
jgi:hypothetical protein